MILVGLSMYRYVKRKVFPNGFTALHHLLEVWFWQKEVLTMNKIKTVMIFHQLLLLFANGISNIFQNMEGGSSICDSAT